MSTHTVLYISRFLSSTAHSVPRHGARLPIASGMMVHCTHHVFFAQKTSKNALLGCFIREEKRVGTMHHHAVIASRAPQAHSLGVAPGTLLWGCEKYLLCETSEKTETCCCFRSEPKLGFEQFWIPSSQQKTVWIPSEQFGGCI